jgi:hypothetical protein
MAVGVAAPQTHQGWSRWVADDVVDFPACVEDEDVAGVGVGPPPAERGVDGQASEDGGGLDCVD